MSREVCGECRSRPGVKHMRPASSFPGGGAHPACLPEHGFEGCPRGPGEWQWSLLRGSALGALGQWGRSMRREFRLVQCKSHIDRRRGWPHDARSESATEAGQWRGAGKADRLMKVSHGTDRQQDCDVFIRREVDHVQRRLGWCEIQREAGRSGRCHCE